MAVQLLKSFNGKKKSAFVIQLEYRDELLEITRLCWSYILLFLSNWLIPPLFFFGRHLVPVSRKRAWVRGWNVAWDGRVAKPRPEIVTYFGRYVGLIEKLFGIIFLFDKFVALLTLYLGSSLAFRLILSKYSSLFTLKSSLHREPSVSRVTCSQTCSHVLRDAYDQKWLTRIVIFFKNRSHIWYRFAYAFFSSTLFALRVDRKNLFSVLSLLLQTFPSV